MERENGMEMEMKVGATEKEGNHSSPHSTALANVLCLCENAYLHRPTLFNCISLWADITVTQINLPCTGKCDDAQAKVWQRHYAHN